MRGQAALEYLTTYGWAFMVILVMVGGLVYLGVTDRESLIPESCNVPPEFSCDDFQLLYTADASPVGYGSEVSLVLKNNMKKEVLLQRMYITYDGVTPGDSGTEQYCGVYRELSYSGQGSPTYSLSPGAKVEVICNYGASAHIMFPQRGQKEKVTFEFTYTLSDTGFPHKVEGEVIAAVQ